ncbi:uncharacterized protein LOC128224924 [Mya arenaria]|uniref:uncharacterized protein LOC128224924 n=1 Tax=Mya arenaria TaxID=6604 RepID=UPI0022E64783|nr:uncharacterized protein LOC128224924 [Mya arenaria]
MSCHLTSVRIKLLQLLHFRPSCNISLIDTSQKLLSQGCYGSARSSQLLCQQQIRGCMTAHVCQAQGQLDSCKNNEATASFHNMLNSLKMQAHVNEKSHEYSSVTLYSDIGDDNHSHSRKDSRNRLCKNVPLSESYILHFSQPNVQKTNGDSLNNSTSDQKTDSDDGKKDDLPSPAQLSDIRKYYMQQLPVCHKGGTMDDLKTGRHHLDIVFENLFFEKPIITQGILKYSYQQVKFKCLLHFRFVSFYVLPINVTTHYDQGCIVIHWRLHTLTFTALVRSILAFKWLDRTTYYRTVEGISTIYANSDGKIIKHRLERKIPLDTAQPSKAELLAAKLVGRKNLATQSFSKKN